MSRAARVDHHLQRSFAIVEIAFAFDVYRQRDFQFARTDSSELLNHP